MEDYYFGEYFFFVPNRLAWIEIKEEFVEGDKVGDPLVKEEELV